MVDGGGGGKSGRPHCCAVRIEDFASGTLTSRCATPLCFFKALSEAARFAWSRAASGRCTYRSFDRTSFASGSSQTRASSTAVAFGPCSRRLQRRVTAIAVAAAAIAEQQQLGHRKMITTVTRMRMVSAMVASVEVRQQVIVFYASPSTRTRLPSCGENSASSQQQ